MTTALNAENLYRDNPHAFRDATGRKVALFTADGEECALKASDVTLEAVSIALGNIRRYGGHAVAAPSVAEHSIEVGYLVLADSSVKGPRWTMALAGLLHDAHEAYLGDIIKPLKVHPAYAFMAEWEQQVDKVIGASFKIDPKLFHHEKVKAADLKSYRLEQERSRVGTFDSQDAALRFKSAVQYFQAKRKEHGE